MTPLLPLLTLGLLLPACGGDTTGLAPGQEAVTGTVLAIHDAVPVDGPVELELEASGGKLERAFLPSFFTAEPQPEENWEIYRRITELELGDRVRVVGEREGARLRILSLHELALR